MTAYSPKALLSIIRISTHLIDLWSPEAEIQLLGTAAKESHLGALGLVQIGGPARGIMQVEPFTERDNWQNCLRYDRALRKKVTDATGLDGPDNVRLMMDPVYNIIMARIWYRRRPGKLPDVDDLDGQAEYWNDHYNINDDHGWPWEYKECWSKYVQPFL